MQIAEERDSRHDPHHVMDWGKYTIYEDVLCSSFISEDYSCFKGHIIDILKQVGYTAA